MSALQVLLNQCEDQLRLGRADLVSKKLSQLNPASVPRSLRLGFANVCRRSGLTQLGLRMLAPLVRPELQKGTLDATAHEVAEYAFLALKNGLVDEAIRLLKTPPGSLCPEADLYMGYCHLIRWEHELAMPYINAFLHQAPENYIKRVAEMNLISALVYTHQWDEALARLEGVLTAAKSGGLLRLQGNALELRGQIYLHYQKYDLCQQDLEAATRIFGAEESTDQILVLKWNAFLKSVRDQTAQPIAEFRRLALARKHWESVRECDFFQLKFAFDQDLYLHLYHGTPFQSYRNRVQQEVGSLPRRPDYFYGTGSTRFVDLVAGTLDSGEAIPSQIQWFLRALMRDFYRPHSLGAIFAELAPGEYYDPFTSQNRIHQALWRTRQWLEQNELPLRISSRGSQYHLIFDGEVAFRLPVELPATKEAVLCRQNLERLQQVFGNRKFKSSQAADTLSASLSTFHTIADWALKNNLLTRTGQGKSTRYWVTNNQIFG